MLSLRQLCDISIIISNFTKEEPEAQSGTVVGLSHTAGNKVRAGLFTDGSAPVDPKLCEVLTL